MRTWLVTLTLVETMSKITIDAHNVSKRFRIGARQQRYVTMRDSMVEAAKSPLKTIGRVLRPSTEEVTALEDISFQVKEGDAVAIIGRNGAGKSTLLKVISRIMEPSSGYVDVYARVGTLLEVGTGFHTELTGRENIYLNGAILGMRKAEIDRTFDEIVAFAGVERYIDTPVKRYSTGMHMRLAFAVAAHLQTEILLVDEVLAVGDTEFQKKCLGKLGDVTSQGRTVLFVSHNMGAVRNLCDKGIVLDGGRVDVIGNVDECIEAYYRSIGALGRSDAGGSDAHSDTRSVFGPVMINDGAQRDSVSQSEGFEVSTSIKLDSRPEGFTIYCQLEDMHGRVICRLRAESNHLDYVRDGNGHAGRYPVKVAFPPLWLNPGLYAVEFKADFSGSFTSRQMASSDKHPIDVVGEHSVADRSSRVDAILNPQVNWSLSNPAIGNGASS